MDLCLTTCETSRVDWGVNLHISSFFIISVSHKKKASEDGPEDGGQANVSTTDSLRAQLEGMSMLLKKLQVLIFLTVSGLKLLPPHVFREPEEGEPAAAGENTGSPEASNTEAALPGEVHNTTL